MSNKVHFNVLGYYEELYEYERAEFLGTRLVEWPDRPLGTPGTIDVEITEPITLNRGPKTKAFKASKKKPLRCRATLQMICGRQLQRGDFIKILSQDTITLPLTGQISEFNDNGTVKVDMGAEQKDIEAWRLSLINS